MEENDPKLGLLDLLVIVLSFYVLIALVVDTFFELPKDTSQLLQIIDNVICLFFLLEFCVRFFRAPNKLVFMRWGWIDLLASIPAVDQLRAGRLIRLFRLLRILRLFRSTKHLVSYVYRNRAYGTFTTVIIIAVLLVLTSSIAILQVEKDPLSNIKGPEDALWWSYVTMTTVGYGDRYPVTTEGRIIAAILMTAGVGLFGTFTGLLASWFVAEKKSPENPGIEQDFHQSKAQSHAEHVQTNQAPKGPARAHKKEPQSKTEFGAWRGGHSTDH
jgi:voltage-gated potassium channel